MTPLDEWITEARELGINAASCAATWVTDGNESDNSRRRKLAMLEAGDAALLDYLPREPNLSGEFADDLTPLSLAREITGEEEPTDDTSDAIADAYMGGVQDTFIIACETELRKWIEAAR